MIKLIAMATMLIDHIGAVFFPNALWLRIIGRLAFPLFAWGIAMGYMRTSNWKIYAIRLLAAGLISQLPYSLLFQNNHLNICFTLLAGLLALKVLDSRNQWIRVFGLISIMALVHIFDFEYGNYGMLTILVFITTGIMETCLCIKASQHGRHTGISSAYNTAFRLFLLLLPRLQRYDFRLNKHCNMVSIQSI